MRTGDGRPSSRARVALLLVGTGLLWVLVLASMSALLDYLP